MGPDVWNRSTHAKSRRTTEWVGRSDGIRAWPQKRSHADGPKHDGGHRTLQQNNPDIAAGQTETGTHGDAEEDQHPDDVYAVITGHSEGEPDDREDAAEDQGAHRGEAGRSQQENKPPEVPLYRTRRSWPAARTAHGRRRARPLPARSLRLSMSRGSTRRGRREGNRAQMRSHYKRLHTVPSGDAHDPWSPEVVLLALRQ
jgi:hypothetical protein